MGQNLIYVVYHYSRRDKWYTTYIKSKPASTTGLTSELKNYDSSFDRLKIDQNIVVRSWEQNTPENPIWLVCIPKSIQEEIIGLRHDPLADARFARE